MRPRLFGDNPSRFDTNGIGVLTKTVSAFVKEELNGEYSLTMQIAVDDPQFKNIHIGSCIAVQPNKYDQRQGFIVEHIKKPIDGICEIYATHIVQYRGKLIPVNPFEATSLATALTAMKNNSTETNPFTITTDKSVSSAMKISVPRTFRELMGGVSGSLLDTYGGEYYYNNYDIELLNRRGRETNIRILYGKNMTAFDLNEDFSWTDSLTGVIPFWAAEDGTVVVGSVHYSDLATNFPYARTGVLDCSGTFAEPPTEEQLDNYAATWIQNKGNIVVNLNVAFDHMQITDTDMQIGDTVTVINSMYNTEVKRRIVGYEFNVLTEEYETVTIGALKASVNSAIEAIGLVSGDSSGGGGTSYSEMTEEEATAGTSRDPRVISAYVLNKAIESASVSHADSADTATDATYATRLKTGRAIDGVTFTGTAAIRHNTTCDTAEATVAKVAALSNFTLVTGSRVTVLFTYALPANATLNVNGTGAKPIWFNGAAITAGVIPAGASVTFIYDGTNYLVITSNKWTPTYQGWANTQTKLVGESVNLPTFGNVITSSVNNSISANANNKAVYPYTSQIVDQNIYSTVFMGNCSTAADVAAKTVTVGSSFHLHAGVQVVVKFTHTNTASDCTLNVNSSGAYPIYYNAAEYTSNSALVCGTADRYIRYMFSGTHWVWLGHSADNNTTYSSMSQSEATTGTATTGRLISAKVLHDTIENGQANGFGKVKVGNTTVSSGSPNDTLTITEGSNIVITPDASGKTIGIAAAVPSYHEMTYSEALAGSDQTASLISALTLNDVFNYHKSDVYIGECNTDPSESIKVVTIPDGSILYRVKNGTTIFVHFNSANNTASHVQLNVGSSGPKNIYYDNYDFTLSGNTDPDVCGRGDTFIKYVYVDDYWVWAGASFDNDTKYATMTQAEADAGTSDWAKLISAEVLHTTIQNAISSAPAQTLKSCVIGQPNTDSADNWFKVAESSMPSSAGDRDLIFFVSALYPSSSEDYGRKVGILRLHARTGSTGFSPTSLQNNLIWLSNTGFDASDFAIAFNTDGLPGTVQLWVKIEHRYQRYSFTLLKESSRTAMLSSTELFSGTTGAAAPTSGYTVVYSTNEYSTDHLYLGECDTAAATAAKVITVDDPRFALTKGVEIYVKFTNSNSASDVTLNVNGTGALPIWYGASAYTGSSTTVCGYAERYIKYVYDGTYWVWAGHSTDLNTTYTNMSQTEANTGTATTARTISAKVLETKIENVLSSYFQYESASYTYSLAAGAVYSGTVSSAVGNSIFALAGFNSGNNNVVFTNVRKYDSDGDIHYTIRNVGTSAVSNATLYISFITKPSS